MHQILRSFLDRLTERIVATAGAMVVSAVDTERATQQAEQQSALEDLARQMEAEGKDDIATGIRHRLANAGDGPGATADRLIESVVVDSAVPRLEQQASASTTETGRGKSRKSRKSTSELPSPLNLPPATATEKPETDNATH